MNRRAGGGAAALGRSPSKPKGRRLGPWAVGRAEGPLHCRRPPAVPAQCRPFDRGASPLTFRLFLLEWYMRPRRSFGTFPLTSVCLLAFGCRKSGLRHFFEVFIAPLRLRRGQGAMQGNPCYARLFADLPYTPPNPIIASGGQSRAPPVAGGARRKPSEQGSARKAPRADAARPLRTALRPPNPRGFFDSLPLTSVCLLAFL